MTWIISLLIISFCGIVFFALAGIGKIKKMPREELEKVLAETHPLSQDFHSYFVIPCANFWDQIILPKIYKFFEKLTARFRLFVLKIESRLHRLTNYIRGKRELKQNGNGSAYWEEIKKAGSENK